MKKKQNKMDKQKLYSEIAEFLKSKGATKVAVFGSFVRDEETPDSDIDVMVELPEDVSLMKFVRIERELSEKVGFKVDLLTEEYISPYFINDVRKNMKILLA
jgi:predicted nucleotidyltransferase